MRDETLLVACTIPAVPVSVNRVWRNGRGRTYKNPAAVEFENTAVPLLREARKYPPTDKPCRFLLEVWKKSRRGYDIDNRIKVVQDCLQKAGVMVNDSQIVEVVARKKHLPKGAKDEFIFVQVWAVNENPDEVNAPIRENSVEDSR